MQKESTQPRILTLDIETSPLLGYTWEIWEANVIKVVKRMSILCVSWKWLDEKKPHNIAQIDSKSYKAGVENDYDVVKKIRDLMDEADIVVTQNGKSFDIPILRGRMLELGIAPPSPFKQVDTKVLAKTLFKFESAKLDDMGKYLGFGGKADTGGFATWTGCMAGDRKAWARMIKYNNHDVVLTEAIYLRMRPFMENHPNLNVITGRLAACHMCQGTKLQARGWGYNRTSKYRRYQCRNVDCLTWNKGPSEPLKGLEIK